MEIQPKSKENTTYSGLRKIEGGDRQERPFPRIKEIAGFLKRHDFSAQRAQGVFQQNRPSAVLRPDELTAQNRSFGFRASADDLQPTITLLARSFQVLGSRSARLVDTRFDGPAL